MINFYQKTKKNLTLKYEKLPLELINIIFILFFGLRDEDFVYEHGEFDYYEEPGHKYEVNIEIDINALKDMCDEF